MIILHIFAIRRIPLHATLSLTVCHSPAGSRRLGAVVILISYSDKKKRNCLPGYLWDVPRFSCHKKDRKNHQTRLISNRVTIIHIHTSFLSLPTPKPSKTLRHHKISHWNPLIYGMWQFLRDLSMVRHNQR